MFELRDGQLVLTNVPVPKSGGQVTVKPEASFFLALKRWLHHTFVAYRLVTKVIRESPYVHRLAIKFKLAEPIAEEFGVWRRRYSETISKAWVVTEELIKEFKSETAAIGSDLIVFYVPHSAAIYRDQWEAILWKYEITEEDWDIGFVAAHIREVCHRHGIDFIDPSAEFKAEAARIEPNGERLYFSLDLHWTPQGHNLVGQMLARHVGALRSSQSRL